MEQRIFPALFCIAVLLCICREANAQKGLSFEAGQVFSSFKFDDKASSNEPVLTSKTGGTYCLGYNSLSEKGLILKLSAGLRKAGANTSLSSSMYSWDLQYADIKAGAGYAFGKKRLKPAIIVSPYFAYLLKATQSMNDQVLDIQKSGQIASTDYGLIISPGVFFRISDYLSLFGGYNHIIGLSDIEPDQDQVLNNKGFYLNLGISATLTKSSPNWLQQ